VTIVEPGPFRTDFLSPSHCASVRRRSPTTTHAATGACGIRTAFGQAAGDPVKLSKLSCASPAKQHRRCVPCRLVRIRDRECQTRAGEIGLRAGGASCRSVLTTVSRSAVVGSEYLHYAPDDCVTVDRAHEADCPVRYRGCRRTPQTGPLGLSRRSKNDEFASSRPPARIAPIERPVARQK
jgi:hypothetical protein